MSLSCENEKKWLIYTAESVFNFVYSTSIATTAKIGTTIAGFISLIFYVSYIICQNNFVIAYNAVGSVFADKIWQPGRKLAYFSYAL